MIDHRSYTHNYGYRALSHDITAAILVFQCSIPQIKLTIQYDQLPVGLITQLAEHCTSIAMAMVLNPVQA